VSYSRWGYSVWYTFWNSASSGKSKDEQVLSLWFSMDKTIDWEYTDLLDVTAKDIQRRYNCEIEDAEEAMDYVNKFIKDVDKEYESVK
jgi:hypothetical protein